MTLRDDGPLTLPKPDLDFANREREDLSRHVHVLKVSLIMVLEKNSDQISAQRGLVPGNPSAV